MLALADMSVAPGPQLDAITQFLDNGGVLLRFAGTRLAAGDDTLTPTALRRGGRLLGGALSWESPKHIAPFEAGSPFFGLAAPDEVTVSRQVLAEPETGLAEKTWARLADGTPLVTAERRGKGLIVLFHVTADTTWSNLAVVRPVRRHAAPNRGGSRRAGSGRRECEGRRARNGPPALAHAQRLRRPRPSAAAGRTDRRRFFRRGRRASPAGLLRIARLLASCQRAGRRSGAGARRLRAACRARRRARDRAADRSSPMALAGGPRRPDDRRAGFDLADGRRAIASPRRGRRSCSRGRARASFPSRTRPEPPNPRRFPIATWMRPCRPALPMS